jgi:hypothetical protein
MCYKSEMSKTTERWLLFEYVGLEFTPLSKPFKTKEQAEKEREKYPECLRKGIGLGGDPGKEVAGPRMWHGTDNNWATQYYCVRAARERPARL